MKLVSQEAPMGCAIACTASLVNKSYQQMRRFFVDAKIKESTLGFYNRDIVRVLSKLNLVSKVFSRRKFGNRKIKIGTIVFIRRSKEYPFGHYLLKTKKGWMNPWINYPNISPAKAGYQEKLPGCISWVIEEIK